MSMAVMLIGMALSVSAEAHQDQGALNQDLRNGFLPLCALHRNRLAREYLAVVLQSLALQKSTRSDRLHAKLHLLDP
jgi:hypothetical protein